MPKITDENNIRAKLQEFDNCMNGAIEAADIFIQLKHNADEFKATMTQLQEIENKWNILQNTVTDAVNKSHSAINDIDEHFDVINARLHKENEKLLQEHIQLAKNSSVNAEQVASEREIVQESIQKIESVLTNVQTDFHTKNTKYINEKLTAIENAIETGQDTFFIQQTKQINNLEKDLHGNITVLKEELRTNLNEHQLKTDRKITDFLAKQNVLVQNLSQQIDGFDRSTKTLLTEQNTIRKKVNILDGNLETISKMQKELEEKVNIFDGNLNQLTERLNLTIELLQSTRFIGKSFKRI